VAQETIEIYDALLVTTSHKAYLVSYHNEEYWIPISQVKYIEYGEMKSVPGKYMQKEIKTMEIPLWLAEEKGFV
jgi:hypothetical protein